MQCIYSHVVVIQVLIIITKTITFLIFWFSVSISSYFLFVHHIYVYELAIYSSFFVSSSSSSSSSNRGMVSPSMSVTMARLLLRLIICFPFKRFVLRLTGGLSVFTWSTVTPNKVWTACLISFFVQLLDIYIYIYIYILCTDCR